MDEYKILKRNWKILSTYYMDIEGDNFYDHIQMKNTSGEQIIIDATTIHPDIDRSYSLTQEFLRGVRNIKYENAET